MCADASANRQKGEGGRTPSASFGSDGFACASFPAARLHRSDVPRDTLPQGLGLGNADAHAYASGVVYVIAWAILGRSTGCRGHSYTLLRCI